MLYLSQLLGATLEDSEGERLGKIADLLVTQNGPDTSAFVNALAVEGEEDQPWRVPIEGVELQGDFLRLRVPREQLVLQPVSLLAHEISLAHEVLDKQVIDLERRKAIRVNDVCINEDWRIQGIDTSTLGLVRRLAPNWLLGAASKRTPTGLTPWSSIELIGTSYHQDNSGEESSGSDANPVAIKPNSSQSNAATSLRRYQSGQLAELHPADIADIVHQLTPTQGARLIESLDNETAADALEEIETERQSHILENIQAERAADILEAMGPDEAADLLAKLPEERVRDLLRLMTPEESEDVQELLEYEEDTAGGLMTTDYIVLNQTRSVSDALETVRNIIREQDIHPAYIYCVADETLEDSQLLGVVTLWELLISNPAELLQKIMETDVITVQPDADPRSVAEIMAKYNLLAVPVVSGEDILEGVVTVDDALDVLLPSERRRKPTRMY